MMAPKKFERIPRDMQPIKLDSSITFNSIGGLEDHIKCLREMVLFPLLYSDFFKRFNSTPPKGVLFHGPPGTGKTLLARALANECGRVRGKRVAFFMRKGADIMSMWYGESEKQIKTLFQQAYKMRPSILFFDEIDALAPTRTSGNSEVYSSVVSTLLVEMDGLYDRGDVIVIGATNQPDHLDPALRRPGRFDRELYFPPPSLIARRDILAIYTRHWLPRPNEETLIHIAQMTNGYLGSDLNALCSEAVLKALKRVYPQVYEGDYYCFNSVDTRKVQVTLEDLTSAKRGLLPAGARFSAFPARQLSSTYEPLFKDQLQSAMTLLKQAFPTPDLSQGDAISPSVFLVSGECGQTYLAPALLAQLDNCSGHELSVATLHSAQCYSMESCIISIFTACRRSERSSIIFVPNIVAVWETLSGPGSALFLQLWRSRAAGDNVLLLATCNTYHNELPEELQELFPLYKDCLYRVRAPTSAEVTNFLMPIVEELPNSHVSIPFKIEPTDSASSSGEVIILRSENTSRKRKYVDGFVMSPEPKRTRYNKESCLSIDDEDISFDLKEEKNTFCPERLGKFLRSCADSLCCLGLEALTDLHGQLYKCLRTTSTTKERLSLPSELHSITLRYLKLAKK